MDIINAQKKAKSFSINALMRNKKISQALTDALDAPLGSTKRDAARSLLKSVEGARRNYDGAGGWFSDVWNSIFNPISSAASQKIQQGSTQPSSPAPTSGSGLFNVYGGQTNPVTQQQPDLTKANIQGAAVSPAAGTGVQFMSGSFNLPTLTERGTISSPTSPTYNFGFSLDKTGNVVMPPSGSTSPSLMTLGQPGAGTNVVGGTATPTITSPLDLKPSFALPTTGATAYNGINVPYSWTPVTTDQKDIMNSMFLYERAPDGSMKRVGKYATVTDPNTGGMSTIDLTKATPYQKALYLGENFVRNSLSPEQKSLIDANKWSLTGKQTVKNGYLYIPSTTEIANAAKTGMKYVYNPTSGWTTTAVSAPSLEQKAADDQTKKDVNEAARSMIDATKMDTFGNEGLVAWWSNIDKSMPEGDTKNALRELYEWKMANPGATTEQIEALADRIMSDRDLFSYVTGIPKSSVPVGITLAGQQQQAYDMAMKEMGMYDKLNELFRQQQSGIGYANQMKAYIRDKDQYLEQVDRMKDEAYQKMKMLDMSNPYVANRMDKYINFLDVARGKANLRYSNFLQTAINERNNAITQAQANIEQAMPFFEQTLTNLTNAGTEAYTKLRNSAKDLAASLSGANTYWQEAKTFEKQMLLADAQALSTAASKAKTLSTAENSALIESVTKNKAYDIDSINKLIGSNTGMTATQMLNGLQAGGESLLTEGAKTGSYATDMDGLVNGLKSMTSSEQIDNIKASDMLSGYKTALQGGLKTYISGSEENIKELRNLINELSDYKSYNNIVNSNTISSLQSDFSTLNPRVVEDTAISYATYLKLTGKRPDYSEDNGTFADEIAQDIASLYGTGKLYQ